MQSIYLHSDMQIGRFTRRSLDLPRCPCPGKNAICIQMTPTRWRNWNNCRWDKCSRRQFAGFLSETMIQKALRDAHFLNKSNANSFHHLDKSTVLVLCKLKFQIYSDYSFNIEFGLLMKRWRDEEIRTVNKWVC